MLYHLQKNDIRFAAKVLGQSFIDYPLFQSILPNREYRKKKIEFLSVFLITSGMLKGEVLAPSNKIEGVSIWINSASPKPSSLRILWDCLIPLFLTVEPFSALRFIKAGLMKEKKRKEMLKGSYILLDLIGINPSYQKQGYARKMIESRLAEYDKLPDPCYLETSDKENLAYYEKFNFHLCCQYQLLTTTVYCLLRESRLGKNLTS